MGLSARNVALLRGGEKMPGQKKSRKLDKEERCKGRRRSRTISCKHMPKKDLLTDEDRRLLDELDAIRPRNRCECMNGPRPCLFVSCKQHLYLDVNPITGSIKLNFPDREVWELDETCALDVADRGGVTLEDVGEILNLTRERIRQVEFSGLTKLRQLTGIEEIDDLLG